MFTDFRSGSAAATGNAAPAAATDAAAAADAHAPADASDSGRTTSVQPTIKHLSKHRSATEKHA